MPGLATVHYSLWYVVQSNAPEDGQNYCPKHVELIWIYQQSVIVASSWLYSLPIVINDARSNKY